MTIPYCLPFTILALLAAGCVVVPAPEPITLDEVVRMSREELPIDEIVSKLERSRTVYLLDVKKIIELHGEGVDNRVLDYMLDTEREHIRRRTLDYYAPYGYGVYGPWCWPYPYGHYHDHYGW